jgi:hypothetical protein
LINAALHGGQDIPDFLRRVGVDVGEAWEQLVGLGVQYSKSIEGIEAAVRVLAPRGWAVTTMDTKRSIKLPTPGSVAGPGFQLLKACLVACSIADLLSAVPAVAFAKASSMIPVPPSTVQQVHCCACSPGR